MSDINEIQSGAKIITEFIAISKEIAKLPILPKYTECAKDLYSISKRIMDSNSNIVTWLNNFLNFNFHKETAKSDYLELVTNYYKMKSGKERHMLKFNCRDIENIYARNLDNKIANLFTNDQTKILNALDIFEQLSKSDAQMIEFIEEHIFEQLDKLVLEMESAVENNDLNTAEKIKVESKGALRETSKLIESFNHELVELVIEFANISKTPITLND